MLNAASAGSKGRGRRRRTISVAAPVLHSHPLDHAPRPSAEESTMSKNNPPLSGPGVLMYQHC